MGIPVLDESCFGCCTIKTGARVISWLSVILSAFAFLALLLGEVAFLAILSQDPAKCHGEPNCTAGDPERDMAVANAKVILGVLAVFIGILMILQGLMVIVGISNLYGIYKEKPNYMVPYLIISTISLVFEVLALLAEVVNKGITGTAVSYVFGIALGVYFLLIVHSYFRVLKTTRNGMVV